MAVVAHVAQSRRVTVEMDGPEITARVETSISACIVRIEGVWMNLMNGVKMLL